MAESPPQPPIRQGHQTPRWVYVLVVIVIAGVLMILLLHFLGIGLTHLP